MYGVTKLDICEDVALVSFQKIPLGLTVLYDVFGRFSEQGINIDMISQTAPTSHHVDVSFTCRDSDMVDVLEISKELSDKYPEVRPMVSSGNCKIQLYGEAMRSESGVFARAMECLKDTQAEVQLITTSEVDISLLVGAAQMDEAAAALRKAFGLQ